MPLFWKHYKSDATAFIESLKAKKPTLEAEQRQGRALLWDKRVDRDAQAAAEAARVPQQPYVYQTRHDRGHRRCRRCPAARPVLKAPALP